MLGISTGIANSWISTYLCLFSELQKKSQYKKAAVRRDVGEVTQRKVDKGRFCCQEPGEVNRASLTTFWSLGTFVLQSSSLQNAGRCHQFQNLALN